MLAVVASNGAKGFDWPAFWKKWGHLQGTKIDFLALMASDRDNPISGDWVEQWLRAEVKRRRAAASANGLLTDEAQRVSTGQPESPPQAL
jgi:hypothetical protein